MNQNWTLSWQDEFDRWNAQNWNYDLGNYLPNTNVRGWGNNELQNDTKRNAFVQDGVLIIRAIKEQSQDDRGRTARPTAKSTFLKPEAVSSKWRLVVFILVESGPIINTKAKNIDFPLAQA